MSSGVILLIISLAILAISGVMAGMPGGMPGMLAPPPAEDEAPAAPKSGTSGGSESSFAAVAAAAAVDERGAEEDVAPVLLLPDEPGAVGGRMAAAMDAMRFTSSGLILEKVSAAILAISGVMVIPGGMPACLDMSASCSVGEEERAGG